VGLAMTGADADDDTDDDDDADGLDALSADDADADSYAVGFEAAVLPAFAAAVAAAAAEFLANSTRIVLPRHLQLW
jgi:hypothetical protein